MTIIAFVGPSVGTEKKAAFPGVTWRGPVEAGDLLRLPLGRDMTICLIDGYFDHRPAVRHKEILLLLAGGARIVGAASIGALRAAEMDSLGVEGVGYIYRAYRDGLITGDDEVALAHGPEEWSWRPLSLPLVEVRAALCQAVRRRWLEAKDARHVRDAAGVIHYAERTWDAIGDLLPAGLRERVHSAIPECSVPLKQLDAMAALSVALSARRSRPPAPAPVRTVFLDALAQECGVDLEKRFGELGSTA